MPAPAPQDGRTVECVLPWLAEPFAKWGGSARQNNYTKFLWFDLATVTSQALEYDAFTCTPYEGLNYTILDKIIPL